MTSLVLCAALFAPAPLDPVVRHFVDRGNVIWAIRSYREAYGVGLVEAKRAVDLVVEEQREAAPSGEE